MAEETTTASSSTTPTETTPATDVVQPTPDTSTTSQQPAAETPPAEGSTLLTAAPAESEVETETQTEPTAEEKAAEEARAALFGVPEGDYEITGLPEGMEVDKAAVEAVTPLAKELGLSNEGFSKLAQTYAEKILPSVTEQVTSGIEQQVAATHAQWATEATELVKTDPLFAGKQLTEVQQLSAKAIDRFGGEDFRTFLNETGLGNHPAMLKFAYQAGSMISEDTSFERGGTAPRAKSSTEKFYGTAPVQK